VLGIVVVELGGGIGWLGGWIERRKMMKVVKLKEGRRWWGR